MATSFIKEKSNGFVFYYNNNITKWTMTIKSEVGPQSREYVSDYYVVIMKDGKNVDRCLVSEKNTVYVNNKENIPTYVSNIVTSIMSDGNIIKFLQNESISNTFTEAGAKGNYIRP